MTRAASVVALCLALISTSATAVPILVGPTDGATGIQGLEIDGVTYDVTFSNGATSYEGFYGTDTPTFLGDSSDLSGPFAAAAAIADFLNANSVTDISNMGALNPGDPFRILFIPAVIDINVGPDLVTAANVVYPGTTWGSGGTGRTGSETTSQTSLAWVRFDAVTVP